MFISTNSCIKQLGECLFATFRTFNNEKLNAAAQGVNKTNDSTTESTNMSTPASVQFYISLKESIICSKESTTR